jgi:hypothetical protein
MQKEGSNSHLGKGVKTLEKVTELRKMGQDSGKWDKT